MRRIKRLLLVAALVVPALTTTSIAPAAAATVTVGDAAFSGTATLPTFPCQQPPPFGNGPCSGSFNGSWTGHLDGASGTNVYDVTWSTGGSINASFIYYELQCLSGAETVLGVAQGSGTASAGPGQIKGNWVVPGEPFPRDITGITLTFSFQWTRVANGAVMTLNPVNLQLSVAGLGQRTVLTTTQTAAAVFVPTSFNGSPGVPTCTTPLTNVQGTIAGDVPLVAAQ